MKFKKLCTEELYLKLNDTKVMLVSGKKLAKLLFLAVYSSLNYINQF